MYIPVLDSKPVVDISQNSYTAITGNNVVIPCTVSASPAATSISWRFTSSSGSEIQISSSSSKYSLSGSNNFPQLTILSVGPSDSGTYRCSATNLVGTSSDTASRTVTGSKFHCLSWKLAPSTSKNRGKKFIVMMMYVKCGLIQIKKLFHIMLSLKCQSVTRYCSVFINGYNLSSGVWEKHE